MLFLAAAITDYIDGQLARSRKQETDLGRLLDPLADKLLLVGTFVPMYLLAPTSFPFVTPCRATVGLPLLGRRSSCSAAKLFMTIFRQAAARRGVVIAAIGPAKWKTGFQLDLGGLRRTSGSWPRRSPPSTSWERRRSGAPSRMFNGIVGALMMVGAVVLTMYSLVLYLRSFGGVFATAPSELQ